MNVRIGTGLDVHAFAPEPRPLVLAGCRVSDTDGLAGHSDADVVAHAVADAVLGSLALGDLGSFFGVDTPELAGADSMGLLAQSVGAVVERGWRLGNLDVVVVAQRPRLASRVATMRRSLATTMVLDLDAVSVKATTTDRLGALGRGEGIACWATVLVGSEG